MLEGCAMQVRSGPDTTNAAETGRLRAARPRRLEASVGVDQHRLCGRESASALRRCTRIPPAQLYPERAVACSRAKVAKGQRGMTLLEVLLGFAVFTVGMAGILSMQVMAIRGTQNAGQLSVATNIATSIIEEARVTDFDALSGTQVLHFTQEGEEVGSDDYYRVTREVVPSGSYYKDIEVSVQWRIDSGGKRHSTSMRGRVYEE